MAYGVVKSDPSTPIAEPSEFDDTKGTPKPAKDAPDTQTLLDALAGLSGLLKKLMEASKSATPAKPADPAAALDRLWQMNAGDIQTRYSGNKAYFLADLNYRAAKEAKGAPEQTFRNGGIV